MSRMAFAALASLGEQLESTSKRLELASLVAGFLWGGVFLSIEKGPI